MGSNSFYKINPTDEVWAVDDPESGKGPCLFSFDKVAIYNFWTDYPDKLTPEQIEIIKRDWPELARLKP